MSLRIAIATATPHDRCETFVAAHIARLQNVVLVLTGGSLPEADGQGRWLLGISKIGLLQAMFRRTLLRQDRRAQLRQRIVQLLKSEKVDIVLAEYGVTAMEMMPCCRAAGVPLVTYFLGFDAWDNDVLKRTGNYARLWKEGAGVIVVSDAMRGHLLSLGAPEDRLIVIPCGVDPATTQAADPQNAPPLFIAAGRFAHTKAPNLLLAAFARVVKARPNARLIMVGDGPLWESCRHFVKAEGLEQSVDLVGRMDHAELAAIMSKARAFVQHSVTALNGDSEGMPVAVLEAMAAGLPVVATRHMGIAESVQDGVSGLLCAEHDTATMAEHMIMLVDDPQMAARMGVAGRSIVHDRFLMDQCIAKLQGFLERSKQRT